MHARTLQIKPHLGTTTEENKTEQTARTEHVMSLGRDCTETNTLQAGRETRHWGTARLNRWCTARTCNVTGQMLHRNKQTHSRQGDTSTGHGRTQHRSIAAGGMADEATALSPPAPPGVVSDSSLCSYMEWRCLVAIGCCSQLSCILHAS
ncbi:hypothetical protein PR048_018801 [Dryococelus australis]|uniref:Uncharacterized protein n=1 Tax=Dryococelus australis TaxID=614101 RepID=A0ABQ9H1S3_9NEOP|nr:hypothetical protein PR048_018801 [Dryococelus australis]